MMTAKRKNTKRTRFVLIALSFIVACGGINIFSIEDDKTLGAQVDAEIESNSQEYPLLSEAQFPEAYSHLRRIRDAILNSGQVNHKDDFLWQVHIIQDDETLNAFATPGGYLYFYTGLIKFLDNEDEFAGVFAHEIAHSAERHSTDALTTQYGLSTIADIILGENQNVLSEIALGLTSLSFSRNSESDADEKSVQYLANTDYDCTGAAGFFEKIEGRSQTPEFLSTHPSPSNRVSNINNKAEALNCSTALSGNDYQAFIDSLP